MRASIYTIFLPVLLLLTIPGAAASPAAALPVDPDVFPFVELALVLSMAGVALVELRREAPWRHQDEEAESGPGW